MIHRLLTTIGEYFIFLRQAFSRPEKWRIFFKKLIDEMDAMGIGSMLIVSIVSIAMGSVITTQTAMQIESSSILRKERFTNRRAENSDSEVGRSADQGTRLRHLRDGCAYLSRRRRRSEDTVWNGHRT